MNVAAEKYWEVQNLLGVDLSRNRAVTSNFDEGERNG
jgi:hypothetical protein